MYCRIAGERFSNHRIGTYAHVKRAFPDGFAYLVLLALILPLRALPAEAALALSQDTRGSG
jgi:hypothetical protein